MEEVLMDRIIVFVLILIVTVSAAYFSLRTRPIDVIWGVVTEKDIDKSGIDTSTVRVKMSMLDIERIIELVFDTRDLSGCSHGAEECFHGRGVELDNLIKTGGMITITTHNRFGTRNVHKLVAPVPLKETKLRK